MDESDLGRKNEDHAASAGRSGGAPDVSSMSLKELKELVAGARPEPGDVLWGAVEADERAGARELLRALSRARKRESSERARVEALRHHERELWASGLELVAGVDEAGRGPLAGPVFAAAVVLPREVALPGLNDSKKLSAAKRDDLYDLIMERAVAVGVGSSSEKVIDEMNILRATHRAMREALDALSPAPDHAIVDGDEVPNLPVPHTALHRGDELSAPVAAASIIAKVTRDRLLVELDEKYPGYGFAKHKGYGTPDHIAALRRLGPCEIHRRSFRTVFDADGGYSERYHEFRARLLDAETVADVERAARGIADRKGEFTPYELSKLRSLYKRCYVRARAGVGGSRRERR